MHCAARSLIYTPHMPNYRRPNIPGACWFFTVNLLDRKTCLLTDHIEELRAATREIKGRFPFQIDAMVILPDHIHAIWTLPPDDADFSVRWRRIKAIFSKSLPQTEWRSTVRQKRGERGIWQRRFWEHAIRDEEDYRRHVDYCYYNPVKHGYVEEIADWPHSSYHRDVKAGRYPADGRGKIDDDFKFGE